jgi:hypothetical protein
MTRKGPAVNSSQIEIFLPDLERQLSAAAAKRAEATDRPRRSRYALLRPYRGEKVHNGAPRRFARLVVAAIAVLAIGGTAVARTGIWHPTIGDYAHDGPPSISEEPVPARS